MPDRVELLFRRAAEELLPRSITVVAAVSGGCDSVALLHLLARIAGGWPLRVVVAHLDHGLRRGSAGDRKFVVRMAAGLGVPCVSDRRPVRQLRRKGESPEEAARRIRLAFLREAARRTRADLVATGHTLDDQAETVLMRLVRGAGPSALAGILPRGPGPFVRPLLEIEKDDLRAYLDRRRIPFREDPSNRSLRYDRNRVRRLVLPLLSEILNPRAGRHLVEAARRLREDAAYLDAEAVAALARARLGGSAGRLVLDARVIAALAPPLAKRVARLALEFAGADPRRVSSAHVHALVKLVRERGDRRVDLPGRSTAHRQGDRLLLRRARSAAHRPPVSPAKRRR